MEKANYPSLWKQNNEPTTNKNEVQQMFLDKAFVENFFGKYLNAAKQILQVENLPFDKVKIDYSTDNFCFDVTVHFGNYKNYYVENLEHHTVFGTSTANIQEAIETAVKILKNLKKQELVPIPIISNTDFENKQMTIEDAITENNGKPEKPPKKEKKEKSDIQN